MSVTHTLPSGPEPPLLGSGPEPLLLLNLVAVYFEAFVMGNKRYVGFIMYFLLAFHREAFHPFDGNCAAVRSGLIFEYAGLQLYCTPDRNYTYKNTYFKRLMSHCAYV